MERPLYRHEYVDLPFDEVAQALAEDAPRLLQEATEIAAAATDRVRRDLVVNLGGFEIGREVTIEVGEFQPVEVRRVVLPLRWHASRASALFPSLEATLEVSALALSPPLTQVSLVATYRPPMGTLGAVVDGLWMHRLAEAAVHNLLHEIVRCIEVTAAARREVPGTAAPAQPEHA